MRAQRIIISVSLFTFTTTGYLITLALLHVYNILHGGIISLVVISLGVICLKQDYPLTFPECIEQGYKIE